MSKVKIRRPAPDKRNVRAPVRIPASETNLTVKERAMLPDPDWVTEDDADVIMSLRELEASSGKLYSLEEVLRKNGFPLERSTGVEKQLRQLDENVKEDALQTIAELTAL